MDGSRRVGPLALALLVLAGCAGGGSDSDLKAKGKGGTCTPPATLSISFSANVQPIFNASCALAGCHAGAVPAGDLDLSSGAARAQLVGVAAMQKPKLDRVVAGDADRSYLVQKIEGAPGIAGQQMPLGCPGSPQGGAVCLTADQIAAIRTWIVECALAN